MYIGPGISPINPHRIFAAHVFIAPSRATCMVTWIKGTFLMVLANMSWSLWIVKQAAVLKEYPNKMLMTLSQCIFSTVQSFIVAVVAERDFSKWKLRLDISFTGNHLHCMVCGDERPCLLNCLKKSTLPYIHNILLLHPRRNCSPRQYSWWYTSGWRPDAVV
ncbi:hypothetical protein HU200_064803 [Digitaria exilis]|uniref:WAT1-related protein n=1 Tax=Digitaria exilis TaxID=1010633 RepID=A0A835A533_9POAL|nr:hypothetical protein HU200_064803 [Digitaria exilis]